MINFPFLIIVSLAGALFVLMIFALHAAQLCTDKIEGIVRTEASTRSLLEQKKRAERTAWCAFGLMAFLIMGLALGYMMS